jgi:hypothetical protein
VPYEVYRRFGGQVRMHIFLLVAVAKRFACRAPALLAMCTDCERPVCIT